MDPEAFSDIANKVKELEMFPYFDIAYCLAAALDVREDLQGGAQAFSREHPLACWFTYILVVFAGPVVANGLLAEPILAPLEKTPHVLLASFVWYVIFFTPMDVGYRLAKFFPVKIIFLAMKEVYRCKKVYDGVHHAAELYPDAYLIMFVIGTIKGNGAGFTRLFERLIRGVWTPTATEFMKPSYYTKACLVASVIFVLHKNTELIPASEALVYFGIVIFFIYFKMCYILLGIHDPFASFENFICDFIFGGVIDSFTKLQGLRRGQFEEGETNAVKKTH